MVFMTPFQVAGRNPKVTVTCIYCNFTPKNKLSMAAIWRYRISKHLLILMVVYGKPKIMIYTQHSSFDLKF